MGRPKHALLLADGRSMIEQVAAGLEGFARRVVVLGEIDELSGYKHIPDLTPGLGPLGGLESLLSSGLDEEYLVVPCDMPRLTTTLLWQLLVTTDRTATIFKIAGESHPEPFPLRISSEALAVVVKQIKRRQLSMGGLLEELGPEVVELDEKEAPLLANINTPEEWAAISDEEEPEKGS